MKLYNGDCLEVMKKLPDNSVDSIVTDPPYGLKFMGKKWDYEIPSVEIWQEAIRVLKPGGHLLSFGGSRTYHRMAVAIEDAGFEIRDQIMWVYGSGFPKSRRYKLSPKFCQCDAVEHNVGSTNPLPKQDDHNNKVLAESDDDHFLQDVQRSRSVDVSSLGDYQRDYDSSDEQPQVVLSPVPEILPLQEGVQERNHSSSHDDGLVSESLYNPSQVRHNDHLSSQDYSRHSEVYGVQPDKFSDHKLPDHNLSKDDHKPDNLENVSYQNISRAFPLCQMCRKPNADGWGTALKPSHEPICMARKPLSEKTVALNVLKWGTGGINIDASRVGTEIMNNAPAGNKEGGNSLNMSKTGMPQDVEGTTSLGRFPANFIHDGSDEVVGLLGEPARFFYFPKASKKERYVYLTCNCQTVKLESWPKQDQNLNEQTDGTSPEADTYEEQSEVDLFSNTSISGKKKMEKSLSDTHSITSTTSKQTTDSAISSSSMLLNTNESTEGVNLETENGGSPAQSVGNSSKLQPTTGISPQKDGHFMGVVVPATSAGWYRKSVCVDCGSEVRHNGHPTQKPTSLMQYLVRMFTPVGGICLDPFMGSGSTGKACVLEGFDFIGIEKDPEYCKIAEARIEYEVGKP